MEEQINKYYCPDITELYVGYECQIRNTYYSDLKEGWSETKKIDVNTIKFIVNSFIPEHLIHIRTPYLSKEDIESLGWSHTGGQMISGGRQDYQKDGFFLTWPINYKTPTIIEIHNDGDYDEYETFFKGECKSKNELKKIMEYLGISRNN